VVERVKLTYKTIGTTYKATVSGCHVLFVQSGRCVNTNKRVHVHPSICLSTCFISVTTKQISIKFGMGVYTKICGENFNFGSHRSSQLPIVLYKS